MTIYKKNGKYYSRFKIHGEQKHFLCQGATTQAQAQAIEDAEKFKLRQQQAGLLGKDLKNISVSVWVDRYNKYSELNKKSYLTDKSRGHVIKEFFGSTTLIKTIKPEKIEKFKDYLLNQGKTKTTVNRYLEQLGAMFTFAINNEWLVENPKKKVKKFPVQNYTIRYLTDDEEKRLFKVLPEYLKGIVLVALNTGLRKANILELKWEQINFEFRFIEVLENKGNKHIYLPMNDTLYNYFSKIEDKTGYVFINPETQEPYKDIKKAWTTSLTKANIKGFRFHDLRHTVGTRLAKNNVPVNVIKEILSHSDIKTTMRYVHLTENAKREAMSIL